MTVDISDHACLRLRTNGDSVRVFAARGGVGTTTPSLTNTRKDRAMATPDVISPAYLRQLIDYNPETGELTWRPRTPDMFTEGDAGYRRARTPEHKCANWNAKLAGKPAFTSFTTQGYRQGTIRQIRASPLKAHRVAWAIYHGEWPDGVIDHINGDRADNRIANLRDIPQTLNLRNAKRPRNNTSGYPGISWFTQTSRWHVRVPGHNGTGHVGFFKTLDEAVAARDAAREGLGYTGRGDASALRKRMGKMDRRIRA